MFLLPPPPEITLMAPMQVHPTHTSRKVLGNCNYAKPQYNTPLTVTKYCQQP